MTDEELDRTDILMGDLEDRHSVDVHRRVADIIGAEGSRPNALHQAIAALAASGPQIRIVTTNYDLHLSEALDAMEKPFMTDTAPSLPLGNDFNGIVYLHGSLSRPARQLVVTDADFGQAYLRDAWATRFLERMFSHYTVLFVGYSYQDVVMSYLGRGLGPDTARYVLTNQPDLPHWRRLRIQPIVYSNPDGTHSRLTDVISGWAAWASMGLLDHRQRVSDLLAAPPSQIPEEESYLETIVASEQTARFFAEFARGPQWLSWASGRPEFRRLLDSADGNVTGSAVLATWFADHYVTNEELSEQALALISEAGGRIGPVLWSEIGRNLQRQTVPRPAWLTRWLVLLVRNAPATAQPWPEYALHDSVWPDDRMAALLLFDHLAEPQPTYRPSFAAASGTRIEIVPRGEVYWLREAWTKVFLPNIADAAPDLIVIADHHLRRAHQLLSAGGAARPGWDPMSFSRSAIEPHSQDTMAEPADVLIDAARDCLESLVRRGDEAGPGHLRMWADSDVPLLRRLAVHGWASRTDVTASAKLAWLRDRRWLFDHQLRHEVFGLIAAAIADADTPTADDLVAEAETGPEGSEHRDYESYNALTWIARHAPRLQSAATALARAQAAHPEYQERPHPDLNSWMETGWVGPHPPMSAQDLHVLIQQNPTSALEKLRQYEGTTSPFDRPSWDDALNVLADVTREWPTDGFAVLDADNDSLPDILRAVIRGWSAASADDATARAILGRLSHAGLSAVAADVTQMLADGGQTETAPTQWHRIPEARHLAVQTWVLSHGTASTITTEDWLLRAINHPAGQLAQFWVHAVAGDWTAAGDDWHGIPPEARTQLEMMLASNDDRGQMTEVIFASQLHFFHSADPEWAQNHILPLLDWATPDRAQRAWEGYLAYGRFNDKILAAGLLNHYIQAATHADELPENLRQPLYGHLADIALRSNIDLAANGWLRNLTSTSSEEVRTGWMNQIGWRLRTISAQAVEQQWNRWIHTYWQDRLASRPIQLTTQEASAMAAWVIYLTSSLNEGIDLATAHAAGIPRHSHLLRDLTDERISQQPPATARLLAHLLRGTEEPFYDCPEIQRIIRALADNAEPADITSIREQALRLGCESR